MHRPLPNIGASTFRSETRRDPRHACGFTILELLVCMGIISLLAALLLPAIGSSREAARRITCANNLHQIGIALSSYHESHESLPIGWQWEASGQSAYGWSVALLPYLEQRELYRLTDRNDPLDSPLNETARGQAVSGFLCPSDITTPLFTLNSEETAYTASVPLLTLPTANYVAVFGTLEADDGFPAPKGDGPFLEGESVRWQDLDNGLSHTLLVGERTMARVPSTWLGIDVRGEDAACRLVGSAITAPNCKHCDECEFDSRHPGGSLFLWADGHVALLEETVDTATYRQMASRFTP